VCYKARGDHHRAPNGEKFFASFFQKRSSFLPHADPRGMDCGRLCAKVMASE
jgi:hypothetical protein